NAENTMTILLSELPAYRFLLDHFPPEDVRHARLELRRARYRAAVAEVYYRTKEEHKKYSNLERAQVRFPGRIDPPASSRDWNKAYRMLDELKKRYEIAGLGKLPRPPLAEHSVPFMRSIVGLFRTKALWLASRRPIRTAFRRRPETDVKKRTSTIAP